MDHTVTDITPIRCLHATGNTIIDVVIISGKLWVRIIDYRTNHKLEQLHAHPETINQSHYGKIVNKIIPKAFEYCKLISKRLSLQDLTEDSIQLRKLLSQSSHGSATTLMEKTGFTFGRLADAANQLQEKGLIKIYSYSSYTYHDKYSHLRDYFDPQKNLIFL